MSVVYPGAVPEEVEYSIVVKIEEQVEALEDAKAVKSLAAPGLASVRVELKTGADIGEAMDEVKSAVGRIQSFPGAAERPQFREMDNRTSMIRLIVFGDIPERSLKELAHQIEDDLGTLPNVSQVETTGTRNYEISIEVPIVRLRALGLTLDDVADAIRRSSLDLSADSDVARASTDRCLSACQLATSQGSSSHVNVLAPLDPPKAICLSRVCTADTGVRKHSRSSLARLAWSHPVKEMAPMRACALRPDS